MIIKASLKICNCGCGKEFVGRNEYIKNHNKQEIIFCECGCGQNMFLYNDYGYIKKYIKGHFLAKLNKGKNLSKETRKKISKSRIGKTLEIRHGKEKADIIKKKFKLSSHFNNFKNKTLEENYGLKKAQEIKEKMSRKKKEFIQKNGTSFLTRKHKPETIEKLKIIRSKRVFPLKDTTIEVKLQMYLKELKIEFFTHRYMNEIKHAYQCDIFIPSLNLVVECDGDYWHRYPTGRDIDHVRTAELLEKGFKVLRLWEFEIKDLGLDEFKNRIYEYTPQ